MIAVTPDLEARLAAKKAAWHQERGLPSWTCLVGRHRLHSATRPAACPKCAAVTHEDDIRGCACGAPATLAPVLRVWPNALKTGAPANLAFQNAEACGPCAGRSTVADLATPAFRAQLDQAWAKAGKPPICWDSAELHWNVGVAP